MLDINHVCRNRMSQISDPQTLRHPGLVPGSIVPRTLQALFVRHDAFE